MDITEHYDLDTDATLGGNNASDYVIPSQNAVKTYVDNTVGNIETILHNINSGS